MGQSKIEGTQPLTMVVVTEVQPGIAPVKQLKPKPKKEPKPKVKVVYKQDMERMTNRDWTAVKKRLRFVLKELLHDYDFRQERWLILRNAAPPKAAQRRIKKEALAMIRAFEKVLSFEGQINGVKFTEADFRPSNFYRFHIGPNAIYEPHNYFPTKNLDKHPDAMDELNSKLEAAKKAENSEFKNVNLLKRDGPQYPFWKR